MNNKPLPYLYWVHKRKPSRLRLYTFHAIDNYLKESETDLFGSNFPIYVGANSIWEAKYNMPKMFEVKRITVSNKRNFDLSSLIKYCYIRFIRRIMR